MDSIRSIQPPGKWKIIVVDSKSNQILNAACKMYDILEENVSAVIAVWRSVLTMDFIRWHVRRM